jgi:hypothetical protein
MTTLQKIVPAFKGDLMIVKYLAKDDGFLPLRLF